MQVNPEAETYGEIFSAEDDAAMARKIQEAREQGEPIMVADSKAQLRKLQDDLRKAGYKRCTW